MTPRMESVWIFIGAGVLVAILLVLIGLTGRHARKIDIRSGMPYWRHRIGS